MNSGPLIGLNIISVIFNPEKSIGIKIVFSDNALQILSSKHLAFMIVVLLI